MTKWCISEVTIAADAIRSECEYTGTTFLKQATVTALVTGIVDGSGNINFSYEFPK